MKKKILFSIVMLMAMVLFIGTVHADRAVEIDFEVPAKAPETVPAAGDVLYGLVSQDFDFSQVKFASATDGGPDVSGKTNMRKIILGTLNKDNIKAARTGDPAVLNPSDLQKDTPVKTLNNAFSKWFTAYCLDDSKRFPIYGLLSNPGTDEVDKVVLAAIANNPEIQAKIAEIVTGPTNSFQVVEGGNKTYAELSYKDATSGEWIIAADDNEFLDKVYNLETPVRFNLDKIIFAKSAGGYYEVIAHADGDDFFIEFTGMDILFQKYTATNYNNINNYNHALWIIEHSYPTLTLEESLELAGASLTTLKSQVAALHTGMSSEGIDVFTENYVYGTVQYAIWKATGYEEVGNSIKTEGLSELNKLYQFLIEDRDEYEGYSTKTYTNKITVHKPEAGKELVGENKAKTGYIYGPFKATYDVVDAGDMTVTITNEDKTGIKVVDKDEHEITTVGYGEEFYIECLKSAKIGSVKAKVTLENAAMFSPTTNRGRIYFPTFTLGQNTISAGKIVHSNIAESFDFPINAKTGVENIALLLMVTLVAFTLAYLVLSYKQKPVTLS